MSETNAGFIHRMLDNIDSYIQNERRSFIDRLLMKIRNRAYDEVYMDPNWFIIALHVRHSGKPWSEMQKYGVKEGEITKDANN